ncbi:MAG: hypothetical protein CMJ64_04770, partial [Planctomycetaceae bacterium]|nr:hypothetical protein [Planctomycetaceae bacterium]
RMGNRNEIPHLPQVETPKPIYSNLQNECCFIGSSKSKSKSSKSKQPLRGGSLQANLTPQQQALLARKANDCLQVLAFMKNGNIIPTEFPAFPIKKIPQYRKTATQLLNVMGPAGTQAVVGQLRNHLMSGFPKQSDVACHLGYVDGLLEVLANSAASGRLSPRDLDSLEQAMQGAKPREVEVLSRRINETISKNLDIQSLLDWADKTKDSKRKTQILSKLRTKLANATPTELEQALLSPDVQSNTKALIVNHLRKFLPDQSVPGLLNLMSVDHAGIQKSAETELRKRQPKYDEVRGDITRLGEFSSSGNERVAAYADWHIANAFKQAPISHCLYWLGQEDPKLISVIWKQVDQRIRSANDDRKAAYAKTAVTALQLKDISQESQDACLEFLGRLKYRSAVKPLVDQLPQMKRELWPKVGETLKQITDADHGPKPGARGADVAVAGKRWREWLRHGE